MSHKEGLLNRSNDGGNFQDQEDPELVKRASNDKSDNSLSKSMVRDVTLLWAVDEIKKKGDAHKQ